MSFPKGTRAYLDANLWIFLLNPPAEIEAQLMTIFEQVAAGTLVPVTSVLSWYECLVKPLEKKDPEEKAWFDRVFTQTEGLVLVEITREMLFAAAQLRAAAKVKTPDAIHLASARTAGCDVFLTHDGDLRKDSLKAIMHPMVLQGLS